MALWKCKPLVLASGSAVRRKLLESAGIPLEVRPADIDERAIEAKAKPANAQDAAILLAREKAAAVKGDVVLGADQTLALGERRFSKPKGRAEAKEQLRALSGKTHELHTAVAVMRGGKLAFERAEVALLTMRKLSDAFLDAYLDAAGEAVTHSVGAYQLEGAGAHLFEKVEGDYFTILGLPLISLLAYFRSAGLIES